MDVRRTKALRLSPPLMKWKTCAEAICLANIMGGAAAEIIMAGKNVNSAHIIPFAFLQVYAELII